MTPEQLSEAAIRFLNAVQQTDLWRLMMIGVLVFLIGVLFGPPAVIIYMMRTERAGNREHNKLDELRETNLQKITEVVSGVAFLLDQARQSIQRGLDLTGQQGVALEKLSEMITGRFDAVDLAALTTQKGQGDIIGELADMLTEIHEILPKIKLAAEEGNGRVAAIEAQISNMETRLLDAIRRLQEPGGAGNSTPP